MNRGMTKKKFESSVKIRGSKDKKINSDFEQYFST